MEMSTNLHPNILAEKYSRTEYSVAEKHVFYQSEELLYLTAREGTTMYKNFRKLLP